MRTSGKRGPRVKRWKRDGEGGLPPAGLARLERALARMPRLRREIFLAVRFERMTLDEVARTQGIGARRAEEELARALAGLDRALRGRACLRQVRWLRWFR